MFDSLRSYNYSTTGSSVHRILQARILEYIAMLSSKGSSWPRDQTQVSFASCMAGRVFTTSSALLLLSFAQSCLTLCDPMDCSTPGFPVLHQLSELAHTHVHWVSDAIQPSHPLLPLSPSALNLSQHQSFPMSQFFTSGEQSIGPSASPSVLPVNIWD